MNLFCLDLDGTLEDSRDDMVAAVHRVRAQLALAAQAEEALRAHVHRGMAHLYDACFNEVADKEAIRLAYEAQYGAHIADRTRLYDGVPRALQALADLGALACVTNKPEALARRLLAALGIADRFRAVIGGDTCSAGKPDPVMLRAAERLSGFADDPGRCFMIGDTAGDIRLGLSHGATTVWCAWGYGESADPETPDLIAPTPASLPELIAGSL